MDREHDKDSIIMTAQELAILQLIAAGQSTNKIAETLGLKPPTVMWYRKRLYAKLDVHSAVAFATEMNRRGML